MGDLNLADAKSSQASLSDVQSDGISYDVILRGNDNKGLHGHHSKSMAGYGPSSTSGSRKLSNR